jgi:hypothetical protein
MSFLAKINDQMNCILSLIKKISKSSNKSCSFDLILMENKNNNQKKSLSNDLITSENFRFCHLCNHDVDFELFYLNLIRRFYI